MEFVLVATGLAAAGTYIGRKIKRKNQRKRHTQMMIENGVFNEGFHVVEANANLDNPEFYERCAQLTDSTSNGNLLQNNSYLQLHPGPIVEDVTDAYQDPIAMQQQRLQNFSQAPRVQMQLTDRSEQYLPPPPVHHEPTRSGSQYARHAHIDSSFGQRF